MTPRLRRDPRPEEGKPNRAYRAARHEARGWLAYVAFMIVCLVAAIAFSTHAWL